MNSRDKILAAIKKNKPEATTLPETTLTPGIYTDTSEKFTAVLTGIGGTVLKAATWQDIEATLQLNFPEKKRHVTIRKSFPQPSDDFTKKPHALHDVEVAILEGEFGVAENGAIWITDKAMGDRALPFIAQHLVLVIPKGEIVSNLHEAYARIGASPYDLGTFIAGPSKTADIEQSLVLGAHGAKSLLVFLLG